MAIVFLKKECYSPLQWIEFKCLNHVQPFQRDSLVSALILENKGMCAV